MWLLRGGGGEEEVPPAEDALRDVGFRNRRAVVSSAGEGRAEDIGAEEELVDGVITVGEDGADDGGDGGNMEGIVRGSNRLSCSVCDRS